MGSINSPALDAETANVGDPLATGLETAYLRLQLTLPHRQRPPR